MEKLATQVIKNLQVKISSIHLRYEDDVSSDEARSGLKSTFRPGPGQLDLFCAAAVGPPAARVCGPHPVRDEPAGRAPRRSACARARARRRSR